MQPMYAAMQAPTAQPAPEEMPPVAPPAAAPPDPARNGMAGNERIRAIVAILRKQGRGVKHAKPHHH